MNKWQFSLILCLLTFSTLAETAKDVEYKVKAALIYKLTHFVRWSDSTFKDEQTPFNLCILGQDPFGSNIDALSTRKVKTHPINIQRIAKFTKQNCQILFISLTESNTIDVLENIKKQPILTLSDTNGFAKTGGIIELGKKEGHFHFFINLGKANQVNLKISSVLLNIATILP